MFNFEKLKTRTEHIFHLLTTSKLIEWLKLSFTTSGTEENRQTVTDKVRLTLSVFLLLGAVPDPLEHCR